MLYIYTFAHMALFCSTECWFSDTFIRQLADAEKLRGKVFYSIHILHNNMCEQYVYALCDCDHNNISTQRDNKYVVERQLCFSFVEIARLAKRFARGEIRFRGLFIDLVRSTMDNIYCSHMQIFEYKYTCDSTAIYLPTYISREFLRLLAIQ